MRTVLMQLWAACLVGLGVSVATEASSRHVSGQARLSDGRPVAGAQVMLFDLADLRRGAVARAITDESGQFALPLAALGGSALPQGFALGQNYPNPFNPSTVIPYQLPTATHVRLDVFNVLGQHVATLVDAERPAGFHAAQWAATDATGQAAAAGVYFYRLRGAAVELTRRMVLIDGQAGTASAAPSALATMSTEVAEREYGLVISGEGLATYVDAAFGVEAGMAPVELVVDAAEPSPLDKVLTGGILGDVNDDGQVDANDALVVMYRSNSSIAVPNNGLLLLGDVNGDSQLTRADAQAIMRYVANPLDASLPAGIGQEVRSGKRMAESVRRLTYNSANDGNPSWSPDGHHIAFTSNTFISIDNVVSEIYVIDADGSNLRNLTKEAAFIGASPVWSPDGRRIAFVSDRDGDDEIYVIDADGSNLRNLSKHRTNYDNNPVNDSSPVWSPDGRQILFASLFTGYKSDGFFAIYVMDADGSNLQNLSKLSIEKKGGTLSTSQSRPAWSPNGRHIAFAFGTPEQNLYVMDADGSNLQNLSKHTDNSSPAWSPDGRRIAFISTERDGNGTRSKSNLYVMDADGSNLQNLTDHNAFDFSPVWSPDGRRIAFTSRVGRNTEIYVVDADGSNLQNLTDHSEDDEEPAWSPDGRHIAFASERDGDDDEIYVMEVGASDDGGEEPREEPVVGGPTFEKPTASEKVVVGGREVEAAENEILVFLDEDVSSDEIRATEAEILDQGGSVKSLHLDLRTIQVGITDDIVEQDFINALSRQAGVLGANVNEVVEPDRSFITSNDEGYRQWRTRPPSTPLAKVPAPTSVSFAGDYWINQIDATRAWTALSNPSVKLVPNAIGVVDTGVPRSQDVLNSARISRYTEEGVSMSSDDSSHPHGSNVTGYAAGYSNGPDRRGVNPHSDVVFVDVLRRDSGRTYVTSLLQGIKTAIDKGASVVNISWGDGTRCYHSSPTRRDSRQRWRMNKIGVVHYARKHDALLVWSAGNNCEKQDDRLLPLDETGVVDVANTDSWLSHTLIVGSSTDAQRDACSSRMGKVVNIMAPGAEVGFGSGAGSGTSYAAPMVTGAAGLVRSIERTISAEETRSILVNSARKAITFSTTCGEPVANSPAGLLNLGNAIQSSLVAEGVRLVTADDVYLSKGQTQNMQIDITVPSGGVHAIDVGFVVDQSGSYEDDIATLQARAQEIVESLRSRTDIDVQFGIAGFADFPQGGYGDEGDIEYRLYQDITGDSDALVAAIDKLNKPLMSGDDEPESQYEALFRAAREIGWREGSLRILLLATDSDFHDSDTEPSYPGVGRQVALATLTEENVIVIGLQSGNSSAATEKLQDLAEATGGSVVALDAASSQIVEAVASGLDTALADVDVTLDVLAGQSWVTGVDPTVHEGVSGGQTVRFTVSLTGQRDSSVEDLPYNVYIWARGDGAALLSRTKIPIIVPQEYETSEDHIEGS